MTITVPQVQAFAAEAATVLEQVMAVEPTIAGVVGIFVPQIGLIQPEVMALLPIVQQALQALATGNGGNVEQALVEFAKHILPGLPNSPILSAPAALPQGS